MGKGKSEMGDEFDKACIGSEPLVFTYDATKNELSTKRTINDTQKVRTTTEVLLYSTLIVTR